MTKDKNKNAKPMVMQSFLHAMRETGQIFANITLSLIKNNDFRCFIQTNGRHPNVNRIKRSNSCPDRFVHLSRIDEYEQSRVRSKSSHSCRLERFGIRSNESEVKLAFAKVLEILKMENRPKELNDTLWVHQKVLYPEARIDWPQNKFSKKTKNQEARFRSVEREMARLRESVRHETTPELGDNDENRPGTSRKITLDLNPDRSKFQNWTFQLPKIELSIGPRNVEIETFDRSSYMENLENFEKFFNVYLDKLDDCKCDFKVNRDMNGDRRPTVHELALHAHHRAQASNYLETMILKVIRNPNDADVPYKMRQLLRNIPNLFEKDKITRMREEREKAKARAIERAKRPKRQSSLRRKRTLQLIDCSEPPSPPQTFETRVPYHPAVMYVPSSIREMKVESEFLMTRQQHRMANNYTAAKAVLKILKEQQKRNLLGRGPQSRKHLFTITKKVDD